jgi:hypothetical protein
MPNAVAPTRVCRFSPAWPLCKPGTAVSVSLTTRSTDLGRISLI